MQRCFLALVVLGLAGSSSVGCNGAKATPTPTPSSPAPGPGDVGTDGGTVVDNGVTINVPSGALSEEVTITAEPGTKVARARYAEAGSPFLLSPAGQTFVSPVNVDLPYDPAKLTAEGKTPSDLIVVHRNDTTGLISVHTPTQIDEANRTVRVAVSSFSTLQAAVPATVDATKSSVVLTTNGAVANGTQTVGVVVVAKNLADELFPGAPVVLAATGTQNTLVQPTLPTNEEGQASGSIASTLAEAKTITATVAGVVLGAGPQATFTQSTAPSLRITSPLPLERVPSGLPLTIEWDGLLVTDTTTLSFSTDEGATYSQIASGLPATGTRSWTPPSNAGRVRLKIENAAATVKDEQGADFSFARVWFVNSTATGSNDGTSWENAFTQLHSATTPQLSRTGDQIWVANAAPVTASQNPMASLRREMTLLGGFAGTETAPSQRAQPLVLSVLNAENNRRCVTLGSGGTYRIEGIKCLDGYSGFANGGGMWGVDANLELAHSAFESCEVGYALGGAIALDGEGQVTISRVVFHGNASQNEGGAIYAIAKDQSGASRLTIADSTFTENTALVGGALALVERNKETASMQPRVERCYFSQNTATGNNGSGGAIATVRCKATIVSSTFEGNSATRSGGAIWALLSDLRLSDSSFSENVATGALTPSDGNIVYGGGAVMVDEPRSGGLIERNTFIGNSATLGGGAVALRGPTVEVDTPVFTNNVIARNIAAQGGGMMVGAEGSTSVRFNTITANTANATNIQLRFGSGIGAMHNSKLALYSSIVYGNTDSDIASFVNGSWTFTAETSNFTPAAPDNLSADPGFVDATNNDFHLASGSVCINAGTAADAPATDFDGVTRDASPDIGAFERQ